MQNIKYILIHLLIKLLCSNKPCFGSNMVQDISPQLSATTGFHPPFYMPFQFIESQCLLNLFRYKSTFSSALSSALCQNYSFPSFCICDNPIFNASSRILACLM